MKILITNTALLNTGDLAILMATRRILRRAFARPIAFDIHDQSAGAASALLPELAPRPLIYDDIATVARSRVHRIALIVLALTAARAGDGRIGRVARGLLPATVGRRLRDFSEADLIVSAGGTYLVPYYRLAPKLLELLIAIAARRPFVLFTQSVGSFDRRYRLLGLILRRARLVLVRDEVSRRNLLALGVAPDRIARCADAAFALHDPGAKPTGGSDIGASGNARPRIAVSVRDWPHFDRGSGQTMERYIDAVAGMILSLVRNHGARVRFVSTCQGVPDYWTDDARVAERIVDSLPEDVRPEVEIDREFHDPDRLMSLLREFDAVVSTRMHLAILALNAGVPVLAIAYEFKSMELFRNLGLGRFVRHIDAIDSEILCAAADDLLARRADIKASLPEIVSRASHAAYAAGDNVRQAMEKPI